MIRDGCRANQWARLQQGVTGDIGHDLAVTNH